MFEKIKKWVRSHKLVLVGGSIVTAGSLAVMGYRRRQQNLVRTPDRSFSPDARSGRENSPGKELDRAIGRAEAHISDVRERIDRAEEANRGIGDGLSYLEHLLESEDRGCQHEGSGNHVSEDAACGDGEEYDQVSTSSDQAAESGSGGTAGAVVVCPTIYC